MRPLFVAVAGDAASVNLRSQLLKLPVWRALPSPPEVEVEAFESFRSRALLVFFRDPSIRMTHLDDVDEQARLWFDDGAPFSDVIFLSRHTAASGRPSLCVHPIGVPVDGDAARFGGSLGVFVPPSPLIAALYRRIRRQTLACAETGDAFEMTLEATHHGPKLKTPSCFVEIGSGDAQYSQLAPAALWAGVLNDVVLKEGGAPYYDDFVGDEAKVVVSLGGGHYQPKVGDLCGADDDLFLGHMVASYNFGTLSDDDDDKEDAPWRQTVKTALDATRAAYPLLRPHQERKERLLTVRVEKKAFKSKDRAKLKAYLDDLPGIDVHFV
eukprot:CAMPEP_0118899118 /NCGR_PEP_ID=MMETSP1166-20130328/5817_1 /TAXON_ID=1104430 /ORGANISM="Chrysoreinhardia sp, Strain CCMP3193" /LENGTH=324 /DNA_ID=CAMNT_0006838239 /DNA_START=48 /DNA_END=1022 /DNA_ORIENTATION=+